jgi:hypothetical protein
VVVSEGVEVEEVAHVDVLNAKQVLLPAVVRPASLVRINLENTTYTLLR